ncbi:hypothetical protein J4G43_026945 [Bradyrhizobium barranii subsp. barranii]|uniref:Trypsin-like peptidase n=1 Tax=Bradyrhizobium barranii subsp. barranii TaxID=2823807 RepID=A0A939M8M2_9BRAD|nr:hypothetical protein [Bradyrhizobium barranii]UEM08431.1 hypothetical protein J4G43_026945 [Bradyrhizobium barranii subsp. barranii]
MVITSKKQKPTPEMMEAYLNIALQMRLIMMPFVMPLVRTDEDGPTHVGSGGYIEFSGHKLALTNDHVVREGQGRLAHKFYDSDTYFGFPNAFASEAFPIDLAASSVDLTWTATTHSAMAFPEHRMALIHAPVARELLFLMGFAGSRAYFSPILNIIVTNGTPYLNQEFDPQAEERDIRCEHYDPNLHFAIPWEPEQIEVVDRDDKAIPVNANGFSGSLVWNTRYVEYAAAEKPWDPNVAQLTGVVWGWPQQDRVLLATRIEHVRTFLAKSSK